MDEIIYILTNEAMPEYVKIGKTNNNLIECVRNLSASASIPLPFTIFYACTVKNANYVEKQLHKIFGNNHVNPNRDFFNVSAARVVAVLKMAEIKNVTPKDNAIYYEEDSKALIAAKKKREVFNFEMVNIPIGAKLYFKKDNNIKAKVIALRGDNSIELGKEKTSLALSAQKILGYKYRVVGADYWMYNGEILNERRKRLEAISE